MITTDDIRTTFLDYFRKQGHEVVISAPLVPRNDPTLLFTNAGMVQFKNVFTGQENRACQRATSAQKCIRAGGKHNDLDKVGYTTRHHTFFEMLGNFSFGDYFKETAIALAWDLITREFTVPAERLLVTVHDTDGDAAVLWRKISGLPDTRIIRIPTSDNFWQMGDTGPCGPCSEVFYDHGPHLPGGPPGSAGADGDRFVEVWNLVFMQFEQLSGGERLLLPRPSIDTGMGLERMAAVLQDRHDTYDTDLLRTIIEATAYTAHTDPDGPYRVEHRVIADHLRSSSFLIADGVLPANDGRGYVLRRIMRRAMRHAYKMGTHAPLLWRLVPVLIEQMGTAYPELARAEVLITDSLKLEEERFRRMLERGFKLLDERTISMKPGDVLPGEIAFRLYDTYGFPLDMTQAALRNRSLTVDSDGFEAAMACQKTEARKTWTGSGETTTEAMWFELKDRIGTTEFVGYDSENAEGLLTALVVEGQLVERAEAGTLVMLLANQTPFYAESGGQLGDTGVITLPDKGRVVVSDTLKKLGVMYVHVGQVRDGVIALGDTAHFAVDKIRRAALRAHHSATHLLHAALHCVLGQHILQKGSLVAPDRLRFDINYPKAITDEELRAIETLVNRHIWANRPVLVRLMDLETAVKIGAIALYSEKYDTEVRVVVMGESENFSVELCGGTHVRRTGDIGLFHILSESAVAAGIRRIEAVSSAAAEDCYAKQSAWLMQTAEILKATPEAVPNRVAALLEERHRLEREVTNMRQQLLFTDRDKYFLSDGTVRKIAGITFAARQVDGVPAKDLKGLVDNLKQRFGSGVIVLISDWDRKASVVVGVTDDLTWRVSAVDLVRVGAEVLGGRGGGGRPDMAQAGGPNTNAVPAALLAIEKLLKERIQA